MFSKVLIANRGAIAVRIIRTLKALNVRSVVVYAEADYGSRHVDLADEAVALGSGRLADTYLNADKIIEIALQSGAQAIHPGYGFLSESPEFVAACEAAGLVFLGPTAAQMNAFGLKHEARAIAAQTETPLVPGSNLLSDLASASAAAQQIGYPIMLKSSAGGGGIGMQRVDAPEELAAALIRVQHLSASNFGSDAVFLEKCISRARHIEVQVFGDGLGGVITLGVRDCSAQRRHQKVIEETPAPNLSAATVQALEHTAQRLMAAVHYRSAGTVEFIVDADTEAFYFLEVNTRLQVEHGVTEQVWGVDLVAWMVQLGAGVLPSLAELAQGLAPTGHSIQVRVYAEDPYKDFQPAAGRLTHVQFPEAEHLRIDHWLYPGLEVSPFFDPMLAKVIVTAPTRAQALTQLSDALAQTELYGIETNLGYVQQLLGSALIQQAQITTQSLAEFVAVQPRIDVLKGGTLTTIQDLPGRTGYWDVGIPPSGPFDAHAFAMANRLLENPSTAAGLEMTLQGPSLKFAQDTQVVVTGANIPVHIAGEAQPMWTVLWVRAGQTLRLGTIDGPGARAYLAVRGGIQCPHYLGSRSTFTLGQLGGHNGRALRVGDVLHLQDSTPAPVNTLPAAARPQWGHTWTLRVIYGPHGAPDFFTHADIATFFKQAWEVHYNSSRTGIRLLGPKPEWARPDGGEAGLHPSNIHDNAYAPGTIDFTGDMPVILGPDGPSLGGFVCPATVIRADCWMLGQLRAGDRVQFVPVSQADACQAWADQQAAVADLQPLPQLSVTPQPLTSPILLHVPAHGAHPELTIRPSGDDFLLLELGPQQLDLRLRFRVHALMQRLQAGARPGVLELTPGVRSLQIHYEPERISQAEVMAWAQSQAQSLGDLSDAVVTARTVHLPLSWDDPACQEAIDKYAKTVRADAPWVPSNLEFIRRINGLPDLQAVQDVVFNAEYVVLGLGDVYLGAPVATPVDPRHRLVTTKYNPARTWTAENSVGIGGAYLCVYGMEGPGGYQFVGRTLQMWNRYRQTPDFTQPWLLRFFDHLKFYPVSEAELAQIREDFPLGRFTLKTEPKTFSLQEYEAFLAQHSAEIQQFTQQREGAFQEELARWQATGQAVSEVSDAHQSAPTQLALAAHEQAVESPVTGTIWQCCVQPGETVTAGQPLFVLESMKMEIEVVAEVAGVVSQLPHTAQGHPVVAGDFLAAISTAGR